jgi:hypothetical protein
MASVFDEGQISYALEKIGDYIRESGSGANPEWSDTATKIIIDSLRAFAEKAEKLVVLQFAVAVALGRQGGLKGGPARAAMLTPKQRSESARKAVNARWAKSKKEES